MKPAPFDYERPASLDEALTLLQQPNARALAGGQSLGPMLNLRVAQVDLLVDISRLAELKQVQHRDDTLTVGAAVRHVDFEDGAVPRVLNGVLQRIASAIAYRAVRNRGTIGGSLAHADPAADWPPVLVALGAKVRLRSANGPRSLGADQLITGALETALKSSELIEAVEIPTRAARVAHYKICRKPGDFAESIACISLADGIARVVISGYGQIPVVLTKAGELVVSGDDGALSRAVVEDLQPLKIMSDYHRRLHQTAVVRAARELRS
jgi:aerobic carbon-monoxide dehydrogenase medium subunit